MTLQELRFLVALATEKHFHNAAKKCHVSQPTLSIAIKKLENELGVALFERHKNSVRVTNVGEDVVMRAKRVLNEVDILKEVSATNKNQLNSVVKLGAIYTVGPYLLPPLISSLHALYPTLPIEIYENFTSELKKKLVEGELDAILISLPFEVPGIVTKALYKEPFVVLMPKNHPLTQFQSIPEKALSQYNVLMLGEGHCFRSQVISSCPTCFSQNTTSHSIHWKTVEGGSLETLRHMVVTGIGITILPRSAVQYTPDYENLLTVRPLRGLTPYRTIALAWRDSFTRIKAIDALLKAYTNCSLKLNLATKV